MKHLWILLLMIPMTYALDNPGHYCSTIDTLPSSASDACKGIRINDPTNLVPTAFLTIDNTGVWVTAVSRFTYPVIMAQTLDVTGSLTVNNNIEGNDITANGNFITSHMLFANNISTADSICLRGDCRTVWPSGGGPGGISGTGSAGRIPLFNAATNIIDSQIYQNGANVGIGGVPTTTLDIFGSARIRTLLNCNGASLLETDASGNIVCGTDDSGGAGVIGPGTQNKLAKFNAAGSNIIDSQITDTGNMISIATNVTIGTGNLFINDQAGTGKGIVLRGDDRPMITRNFDTFTSGLYTGVGRWGLFMTPHTVVIGLPNIAAPAKSFAVRAYNPDSTSVDLLKVNYNGDTTIKNDVEVGGVIKSTSGDVIIQLG
jgi:hypothetical protein